MVMVNASDRRMRDIHKGDNTHRSSSVDNDTFWDDRREVRDGTYRRDSTILVSVN